MRKMPFYAPVCVRSPNEPSGHDIEDLEQALRFLREWPASRRGPVYLAAYNACTAAHDGYLTVEEARRSLSGFARITGILEKESPQSATGTVSRQDARLPH